MGDHRWWISDVQRLRGRLSGTGSCATASRRSCARSTSRTSSGGPPRPGGVTESPARAPAPELLERPPRAGRGAGRPGAREPRRSSRQMGKGASLMVLLTLAASATNYASNLIFSRVLSPRQLRRPDRAPRPARRAHRPDRRRADGDRGAGRTARRRRAARPRPLPDPVRDRRTSRSSRSSSAPSTRCRSRSWSRCSTSSRPAPRSRSRRSSTLSFLLPIALGTLQGMDRYLAYGSMFLAIAVSRIAFGVPWASTANGGSGGALAGQALGVCVVLLGAAWLLRGDLIGRGTGAAASGLRRRPDMPAVAGEPRVHRLRRDQQPRHPAGEAVPVRPTTSASTRRCRRSARSSCSSRPRSPS